MQLHLTQAYCGFGEPLAEVNRHAQMRIEAIIAAARPFGYCRQLGYSSSSW